MARSPYSFNFLVSYNFQANRSYMAWKVFQEMRSQNCKPNICTYTAMVNAFARDGLCEKAEEVFEQLQEDGYEPDVYAYNALMEAYRWFSIIALDIFCSVYGNHLWKHQHLWRHFHAGLVRYTSNSFVVCMHEVTDFSCCAVYYSNYTWTSMNNDPFCMVGLFHCMPRHLVDRRNRQKVSLNQMITR